MGVYSPLAEAPSDIPDKALEMNAEFEEFKPFIHPPSGYPR